MLIIGVSAENQIVTAHSYFLVFLGGLVRILIFGFDKRVLDECVEKVAGSNDLTNFPPADFELQESSLSQVQVAVGGRRLGNCVAGHGQNLVDCFLAHWSLLVSV